MSSSCLYLYDGTGNPVGLSTSLSVTALALQYDPYGASTRTDNAGLNGAYTTNPYGFGTGIVNPDTGEIRFGQRYYDPTTGTWTQQDTLNAPLDPTNANRYEYAGDNPVNNSDPTGRSFLDLVAGVVGGIVGTAAGALCQAAGLEIPGSTYICYTFGIEVEIDVSALIAR